MASTLNADAVPEGWAAAIAALTAVPSPNWAAPFLARLPAQGMAVSTLGTLLASETLLATDQVAARLDELQFDLGEGPCWDAVSRRVPVLEPDVQKNRHLVWPAFTLGISDDGVQGVFAFPLLLGPIGIGAIDLYTTTPGSLSLSEITGMRALAAAIARLVLAHTLANVERPMESEETNPHSRRIVHQATGAVTAQLEVTPADALLVLQGRAFAEGRTVKAVADDVLARRMVFRTEQDGIEDTP